MTYPEKLDTGDTLLEQRQEAALKQVNTFLAMHEKKFHSIFPRDPEEYSGAWTDEATDLRLDISQSIAWDGSGWIDTITMAHDKTIPAKKVIFSAHQTVSEGGSYSYEKRTKVYEATDSGEMQLRDVTITDLEEIATICDIASADFAVQIRKGKVARALSDRAAHALGTTMTSEPLGVDESAYFVSLSLKDSQE